MADFTFPPLDPPETPEGAPDALPATVALNPPMVGRASPFEHADGQNRDEILESIRSWTRVELLPWAAAWQVRLVELLASDATWQTAVSTWLNEWADAAEEYINDTVVPESTVISLINTAITNVATPLVNDAIEDADIPAQVVAAAAGLDIALRSDFVTNTGGALYGFSNNVYTYGAGTFTPEEVMNAPSYPGSTSLTGLTTSTGETIVATSTGTAPVFTTDAGSTSFQITAGAGAIHFASTLHTVGVKVKSVPTFSGGTPRAMSPFLLSTIASPAYLFGIIMSSGGNYDIGFFGGTINGDNWSAAGSNTGAAVGYTVVISNARAVMVNDIAHLTIDTVTSTITLRVGGLIVKQGTLSPTQMARLGGRMGVWGNSGAGANQKPTFEWSGAEVENTLSVTRYFPAVDSQGNLGNPTQGSIERNAARYDIRRYGAKSDGKLLSDCSMSANSNVLHSGSYTFTVDDVGKRVGVMGVRAVVAGVNSNGVMIAQIVNVVGGDAILSNSSTVAASGVEAMFGTNDDAAVAAARDAASAAGGGTVVFPVGNTVVAATHACVDGVSYAGADRFASKVYPLKNTDYTADSGVIPTGNWLVSWTTSSNNPAQVDYLRNVDVHDFTIHCRFWCAATDYSPGLKPLNLFRLYNSHVYGMRLYDTPATAIPWDGSVASTIEDNFIQGFGRLWSEGRGGGSGIGVGTGLSGKNSEFIRGNTIIGTQTALTSSTGDNGIFLEAQSNITDPNAVALEGFTVTGNAIIACRRGISDAGGMGSEIAGNQIVGCGVGVALRATVITASFPGRRSKVHDNVIRDGVGPDTYDGTGILILTRSTGGGYSNVGPAIYALIFANVIFRNARHGIRLDAISQNIDGVRIMMNMISENKLSGIRVSKSSGSAVYRMLAIMMNACYGNGTAGTSGDQAGILVDSGVTWQGGRLQDNDLFDLAGSPTQTATYTTTGATLTSVRVAGNTGDA